MDKLTTYCQHIQKLLLDRVNIGSSHPNVETQAIFDTERDHYNEITIKWCGLVGKMLRPGYRVV